MAVQRIIGVDFGTSTSVIRVKRYENGKPAGVGEKLETGSVVFNGMYPMVPTLIQRVGDSTYYGYDAQIAKKKAVLYQGFKVKLESEIPEEREEARALTEDFLGYLARCYREQSEEYLKKQRYLQPGKVSTILLIDMGAGTTDLVLCRYTPGEAPKNESLCTWPKAGEVLFGGQEVDGILKNFVRSRLPEEAAPLLKNFDNSRFKAWKENLVSPALLRGDVVDGFSDLDSSLEMMGVDVEDYGLNRKELERFAGEYLRGLPQLVRGCIREAGIRPAEVELVILTGGHSQWYFTGELLAGKKPEICEALLPQIAADPGRIILISRPQETVALGLAYTPQSAKFSVSDEIQRQEIPADRGPVCADTSSTAEKRGEQAVKSAQGSGAGEKEPGFMDKVESALDKINWSQVGYATMRIMQILSGRG